MTRVATPGDDVRVAFVGAGPGEADLITLRGAARLQDADVVLFDSLADPTLRQLAPNARWIDVGKRGFTGVPHAPRGAAENTGQDTINALLVKHAQSGARVVRLKGGDPSVFGRLEEELEALAAAGIECEVVPGVTAALAAAAATQRPLTRRGTGRSVALTTAMTKTATSSPAATPTPSRSTWPASSSPRSRAASSPRAGRRTRRRSSSRAPAGPTSSRASTASRRSATRPCCTRAGRRSSPSASARCRCTPTATRTPRPTQCPLAEQRPPAVKFAVPAALAAAVRPSPACHPSPP